MALRRRARSAVGLTGVALILLTGGCAEQAPAACRPAELGDGVENVPTESIGSARRFWRAANEQARTWGGALSLTREDDTVIFAFANGATIRAEPIGLCDAAALAAGESYAATLGVPEEVDVQILRVTEERVSGSAQFGGLCGEIPTAQIAASEFVDAASGEWTLRLASYHGASADLQDRDALRACFALDYQLN